MVGSEAASGVHGFLTLEDLRFIDRLTKARGDDAISGAIQTARHKMHAVIALGDMKRLDAILRVISVDNMPVTIGLALLQSTRVVRGRLAEWQAFYHRVEFKLRRDQPSRAEALLLGVSP